MDTLRLEADARGSFTFTFSSARGEMSGRVNVGTEGPPDRRSVATDGKRRKACVNNATPRGYIQRNTTVAEGSPVLSGCRPADPLTLVAAGRHARCGSTVCGDRGATIQHPGWEAGFSVFSVSA